jgi:hypothetical protein
LNDQTINNKIVDLARHRSHEKPCLTDELIQRKQISKYQSPKLKNTFIASPDRAKRAIPMGNYFKNRVFQNDSSEVANEPGKSSFTINKSHSPRIREKMRINIQNNPTPLNITKKNFYK